MRAKVVEQMRRSSRFSDWVVAHPVVWGLGLAAVLVLVGFAFDLAPIVVVTAGLALGVVNILHARRRGYCPVPAEQVAQPAPAQAESPLRERGDD
jgi:hypothetical protein